jgi:3-deoxy-7-phosphoheptulonate synthase
VTDACLHWDDTATLLRGLADSVRQRRQRRAANG